MTHNATALECAAGDIANAYRRVDTLRRDGCPLCDHMEEVQRILVTIHTTLLRLSGEVNRIESQTMR